MKKYLLAIAVMLVTMRVSAQVQELEQLKINLEKLVQLKLMLARAKQGYQMLQNGYNSVRDAAKGNFDLHKRELDRLFTVSTQVKQMPALQKIQDNRNGAHGTYEEWLRHVQDARVFSAGELGGIHARYRAIADMMADDAAQVQLIVTPGILRMNDAERMDAIGMLAKNTELLCTKLRGLIREQSMIAGPRMQDKKDREAMLRFYGKQ